MKLSRRMYGVGLGAGLLILAGSMVGAAAYAANGGPTGNNSNSWSQGLSGGMMGGDWSGGVGRLGPDWSQDDAKDAPTVTLDQAAKLATDWAVVNLPGATLDSGLQMRMGYVFVASKDGKVVAHVIVNDDTAEVSAVNSEDFGGMMGDWDQPGSAESGAVTLDQATQIANDWVTAKYPGATVGAGTQMPIGYLFAASRDGNVVAHVMVNDDNGEVLAGTSRDFGGMMDGWANGARGNLGGGMMPQGLRTGTSMMNGRSV